MVLFMAVSLLLLAIASQAHADNLKIRSPIVGFRELEFEHFGQTTFDKPKSGLSNNQAYSNEIEYGVLPWLKLGIEGNLQAPSGKNLQYDATAVEGTTQLTPQASISPISASSSRSSTPADAATSRPPSSPSGRSWNPSLAESANSGCCTGQTRSLLGCP